LQLYITYIQLFNGDSSEHSAENDSSTYLAYFSDYVYSLEDIQLLRQKLLRLS
jgi:hypothetical protein